MAQFRNIFDVDLQKPTAPHALRQMIAEGDAKGNRIGVRVTNDGATVSLGGTCVGKVIRADGATVTLTGTIDGNLAYVVLDQASCAIEGPIQVAVCWVSSSNVTTLLVAYGTVVNTQTGNAIQPSTPIPDLAQLLAAISDMETATAAANAAAEGALSNFAPAFNESIAYTAGQYVTYTDGKLYQFTTDHAAGAWNSAHVQAVTTGEELTDLKSQIVYVTGNETYSFTKKKGINTGNTSNLSLQTDNDTNCLKIQCTAGDVFTVSGEGWASFALWAFYGAESGGTYPRLSTSGGNASANKAVITAPTGAQYLVMNTKRNPSNYSGFCCKGLLVQTDIDELESINNTSQTIFTPTLSLRAGYVDSNGSIVHSTSNVPVYTQRLYHVSKVDFEIAFTQSQSIWVSVAEYTQDGTFVRRQTGTTAASAGSFSFETDGTTDYIIISFNTFGDTYTTNISCTSQIYNAIKKSVENINGSFATNYHPGYINSSGELVGASANAEVYSDKIYNVSGLEITMSFETAKDIWVVVGAYDANDSFISRTILLNLSSKTIGTGYYTVPSGTDYIIISFRTFSTNYTLDIIPSYRVLSLIGMAAQNESKAMKAVADSQKRKSGLLKLINHRGFNTIAPENTLPAFALSAKKGYKYVECDIRYTSDNVPVILHDATIDRTSNGTGNVADMTLQQLLQYDFGSWKSEAYAGTKIPTFEQFVLLCKRLGLKAYIEIKTTATENQANSVISIINQYNMMNDITLIAFGVDDIKALIKAGATCDAGLLVSSDSLSIYQQAFIRQFSEGRRCFVDVTKDSISQTLIEQAETFGIEIEAWIIDSVSDLENTYSKISGATTNELLIDDIIESYLI